MNICKYPIPSGKGVRKSEYKKKEAAKPTE
jgi:hypothetical protein